MSEESSHSDSLIGRYVGEMRIRYDGDPKLGARYVPLGRKLLGYLKASYGWSGIEVGSKKVTLPNGVRIGALVDGCNHIVFIDVRDEKKPGGREVYIWLETGWVNLENLADHEVPLTFSFLYYGTHQYAALESAVKPRWLDQIILTLNEQDTVSHMREGKVRIPHAPTHANYPDKDYIECIGFQTFESYDDEGRPDFTYTRTDACVPNPGYATGKLKLYLQSLLGGIRNHLFVLDEKDKTDPYNEKIVALVQQIMGSYWAWVNAGIAFNWDFSRGLYTTNDYQYWLISIIDRGVQVQRINLNWRQALLRQTQLRKLKATDTTVLERRKIEAYVLSGGIELDDVIVITDSVLSPLLGSPLHEGWKFNNKGDEAQIVTKEVIWEVNEANGLSTIKWHIFRRYKLQFTYHEDNAEMPFTVQLSTLEEVEATPEEKCLRPFRKPQSSGHILEWEDWHEWLLGPTRGYLSSYIEYDAPLYCWYVLNEIGEESFVTVRDIVKWPDEELSPAEVEAAFNIYCGPTGPVVACGGGGSVQVQNIRFSDWVNAKRGYYLRVESGPTSGVHVDLLQSPADYHVFIELVDGRVDTVTKGTSSWRADADFGGYIDLGFPSGQLNCAGELADLPSEMAGGLWVDVSGENGTYESLKYEHGGTVIFGHTLVFPYHSGDSVYIQRNEYINGTKHIYYNYGWISGFFWSGVATFADGHTASHVEDLRFWMSMTRSGVLSDSYGPSYNDPRFVIEYPAGIFYAAYDGRWPEIRDRRKLYYSSSKNSILVFDETATKTGESYYSNPFFFPHSNWSFPGEGIDTEACFGKHAWYVNIDMLEFWPWFDALVALNESFGGDALYFQQWGPFEDGVPMPFEPIYNTTDDHYPVFLSTDGYSPSADQRQFHSVFVGWV